MRKTYFPFILFLLFGVVFKAIFSLSLTTIGLLKIRERKRKGEVISKLVAVHFHLFIHSFIQVFNYHLWSSSEWMCGVGERGFLVKWFVLKHAELSWTLKRSGINVEFILVDVVIIIIIWCCLNYSSKIRINFPRLENS